MPRITKSTLLLLASLFLLTSLGCQHRDGATDGNLILFLPQSEKPPSHAPEQVTKLTVDGKDVPIEAGGDREFSVKVERVGAGKTVTIVYDYWPYSYSNTIRTKSAKALPGQTIRVDFYTEDPKHPDLIKPIFYPTPVAVVDEMCKMARVGPKDVVYDIGCGDGRLVIAAVKKFGAKKGVGIDINPDLVKLCNENAAKEGVTARVEFRKENALELKDLPDATVVLLYVGEDFGAKIGPLLHEKLKPGARVVSHRFPLGDWRHDDEQYVNCINNDGMKEGYILKLWNIK